MNYYKALNKQVFYKDIYSIVPIRMKDRFDIMKWRNEQIYHLRQHKKLTVENQENYFNEVISKLFEQEQPNQILFSFLENKICVGYGGLVNINWIDKNAEISFVIDTLLEKNSFYNFWVIFLVLIKQLAFDELNLHKIFTYSFDVRPKLYNALEDSDFIKEAILRDHCLIGEYFKDIVVYSSFNSNS